MGFYDDMMLLLTSFKPLREATVEEVFDNPDIETFKEIEGTEDVNSNTDASLLQERRVLYYPTAYHGLFTFNVDTRINTEIDVGRKVWNVASLTGIDCGVKAVFDCYDDKCTYNLNMDDTVTQTGGEQVGDLTAILPSTSNPKCVKNAVLMYDDYLEDSSYIVKDRKRIDTSHLISFYGRSTVRVYKDIFLVYDYNTNFWALVRIVVP